jgi:hypothetical protein
MEEEEEEEEEDDDEVDDVIRCTTWGRAWLGTL